MVIKWLQTFSDHTIWIQDYFEPIFNLQTRKVEFIETPYNADGKNVLAKISTLYKSTILPSPKNLRLNDNGNFGGNIEAVGTDVVIVGDNMSSAFKLFLQSNLSQRILEINTSWLENGHVDEIFNIIRTTSPNKECEFILLYADPELAIDLIQKTENISNISYSDISGSDITRVDTAQCLEKDRDRKKNKLNARCPELVRSNKAYKRIINLDLQNILRSLRKERYCKFKGALPIPVLFSPDKAQRIYGKSTDRALSVNPNGVNGIALENYYIGPRQPIVIFESYLKKSLSSVGVHSIFAPSKHLQRLYGGIHCNVNIVRTCS